MIHRGWAQLASMIDGFDGPEVHLQAKVCTWSIPRDNTFTLLYLPGVSATELIQTARMDERMEGSMSPYAIKVGLFDGQKKGYPLSLNNQGRRNYRNQKKGR